MTYLFGSGCACQGFVGVDTGEQIVEVSAVEGGAGGLPVVLEGDPGVGDGDEVVEVVGSQDLALDAGERQHPGRVLAAAEHASVVGVERGVRDRREASVSEEARGDDGRVWRAAGAAGSGRGPDN